MQSLEFDLIVYAPYRSVEGFILDIEVKLISATLLNYSAFFMPLYFMRGCLVLFGFTAKIVLNLSQFYIAN